MKPAAGKKAFLLINILAPLLMGAVIYYLISPDVIFVKKIDEVFTGHNLPRVFILEHLTGNLGPENFIKSWIPMGFMRNYMLDMLWGYALVFLLFLILDEKTENPKMNLLGRIFFMAAFFSAVMEALQLLPAVTGTFDPADILVEVLAELAAVFIIKIKYLRGGRESYEEEI